MRYLIVEAVTDRGKPTGFAIYGTDDEDLAYALEQAMNRLNLRYAENAGGYPNETTVIDTEDPAAVSATEMLAGVLRELFEIEDGMLAQARRARSCRAASRPTLHLPTTRTVRRESPSAGRTFPRGRQAEEGLRRQVRGALLVAAERDGLPL